MAWYPDWLVALDECSKSGEGMRYGRAIVSPRHARDIIAQLSALKAVSNAAEDWATSAARRLDFLTPTELALYRAVRPNVTSGASSEHPRER